MVEFKGILEIAKQITHPLQLLALIVLGLVIFGVLVLFQGIPRGNAAVLSLIVVALSLFALVFILKVMPPHDFEQATDEAPAEIPLDLRVSPEILERLEPMLNELGYDVKPSVRTSYLDRTYYYSQLQTNGGRDQAKIGMISLDPAFFKFGAEWRRSRWLSRIGNEIIGGSSSRTKKLLVFSDAEMFCQEALIEIHDVKRNDKVEVIFLPKIILDTYRAAATSPSYIRNTLRWYLEL